MYHHDYYVAFDDQENVVAHSADKSTCIQQASSNNSSFNIHTATRMTDGQFLNALQQLRPDDIEFVMAVGGYFCGRLIYHCNGFLFDQYGVPANRFGTTDVRFDIAVC